MRARVRARGCGGYVGTIVSVKNTVHDRSGAFFKDLLLCGTGTYNRHTSTYKVSTYKVSTGVPPIMTNRTQHSLPIKHRIKRERFA